MDPAHPPPARCYRNKGAGSTPPVPTEPQPVTVSEVVHRAVEACEDSTSESLDELLEKFEDDDLAHRRDEVGVDRLELLRLSVRANFDGHPPDHVGRWMAQQGISL